ncbi:MAG: peroxiredoxin [Pseudomonadota bacterium]
MSHLMDVDWSKIPAPQDDGAANHLKGLKLPSVTLGSTFGGTVDTAELSGLTVIYIYPRTGRPDQDLPDGWDMIPGARGCTPQSCAFRDHAAELAALGVDHIFGLSTQSTEYQQEAAERMHLPFALLSDEHLALAEALSLPLFEVEGMQLLKRMTMVIRDGTIEHLFYPVFPPDRNVADLITWLKS